MTPGYSKVAVFKLVLLAGLLTSPIRLHLGVGGLCEPRSLAVRIGLLQCAVAWTKVAVDGQLILIKCSQTLHARWQTELHIEIEVYGEPV